MDAPSASRELSLLFRSVKSLARRSFLNRSSGYGTNVRPVGGEVASACAESSESPPSAEKEDDLKDDKESDGEQSNEPTQSGLGHFHRLPVCRMLSSEPSRLIREICPRFPSTQPTYIFDHFSQTGGCLGLGPTFRLFCRRKTMRIFTRIEMTEYRHRRSK